MIGKTSVDLFPFQGDSRHTMPGKAAGSEFEKRVKGSDVFLRKQSGQELIEFAGRLCYESFELPNEKTKDNDSYVQNIVNLGHESVLEHVSVTFYLEGVSRNLTHELIRHRHLSFSELSQRYVDMSNANVVIPPIYGGGTELMHGAYKAAYEATVAGLGVGGASRKEARQAARYGLPQGTETKIVVTGNLRAWRDVLKKRLSPAADAEIREFASEVLRQLNVEYPDVFKDINDEESK